jgi:hypothetical protein
LSECATEEELRDCCVRTHGLPVDEAGALCLAQAAGMPVGIRECKVRLEEPFWLVDTIIEEGVGKRYQIQVADGALGRVTFVEYHLIDR